VCVQWTVQSETVIGLCKVRSEENKFSGVCTVYSAVRLLLLCVKCTVQ